MKNYIIILITFTSFVFSERGDLISAELLDSKNKADNQVYVYDELPIQLNLDPVSYGYIMYKIVYETIDMNGDYNTASGSLAIPKVDYPLVPSESFPILSYQHGTAVEKSSVTSENGIWILPAFLAGSGYVYIEPDYLGMGESQGRHPYQLKEAYGNSIVDFIRSIKNYDLISDDFHINDQLFLAGYSEGGYATMALHQIIERDYSDELTITASFPSAGAYSMSDIMVNVMTSYEEYGEPFYFPFVLFSYLDEYVEIGLIEDFILPEYLFLYDMFDGYHSSGVINNATPSVPITIMIPEEVQSFQENFNHPLKVALRENDLLDWTPESPMYIFHGIADELVPYENSEVAYDSFVNNGAQDVTLSLIPAEYGGHQDAAPFALLAAYNFSESYKEILCLDEFDCNGQCGGFALVDDCNVCSGGNTGIDYNEYLDCEDVCYGGITYDECNVCGGDGIPNNECDCSGNVFDLCGICGGDNTGCEIIGDVNLDDAINVLDIVETINLIFDETFDSVADVNTDLVINIFDIVLLIELILDN